MRTFDYEIREVEAQSEDAAHYTVVRRNKETGELEVLQGEFVAIPPGGMVPTTFRLNAPGVFDNIVIKGWGWRATQRFLQHNVPA